MLHTLEENDMARQMLVSDAGTQAWPGIEHPPQDRHEIQSDNQLRFFIRMVVTLWPHLLALVVLGMLVLS